MSSEGVAQFIKVPRNIGDVLVDNGWKIFRLYCQFLDLKAQQPDIGVFKIEHSKRYYQRIVSKLIKSEWAWREGRTIHLKSYQHVWRSMGINRIKGKYKYWKLPVEQFSDELREYSQEIQIAIRAKITGRKLAQIRKALKTKGERQSCVTFSAMSSSILFGYKSSSSGSKLRKKYFELIPLDPAVDKPYFDTKEGRFKEPTRRIAI